MVWKENDDIILYIHLLKLTFSFAFFHLQPITFIYLMKKKKLGKKTKYRPESRIQELDCH